jgi:integrase
MRLYTTTLNQMSAFFDQRGLGLLADLTGALVVAFVESLAAKRQQPTVYGGAARARTILSILHQAGATARDLSGAVPKVKAPTKKIPPVYTPDEIDAMLAAVNTASPTGRRDLAVCLLAARLGMRASDICQLTFANLRWAANTIEFTTVKTGRAAVLPLTNEVGEAIIAYLKDGRPESAEPYVFLRAQKPLAKMRPASLHAVITGHLRKAQIAADGRRHGPHALRSSLASRMLEAGTPLPVISEALAHSNSDTTRIYLKIGVEQLRRCALDVAMPAGVWGWGR